ncbi:transposase zinc-binding domain-containing protein [Legionella sp.]|uniref:transposase zinc-binding domain-containing protein n=1 Tax=Legionella sp. TaxID=459 RepID=UPI003D1115EC
MALTLKKLLLKDENWYRYRHFYSEFGGIRESVDYSINKILSCRHYMRIIIARILVYRVHFSCKDRGCSACGKIATNNWLQRIKNFYHPAQSLK